VVLGNWLQGFRSEGQVHRVAGSVIEVNRKAGEHGINGSDLSEAPAPMYAEAAVGQQNQRFNVLTLQFCPLPPFSRILLS